ncbi:MAG TPA: glycosyltransferase [Acidimicrobiales bacterium]|nr:glycosyltransferase [Acidimicrobiales bacterium]
MESRAPAVVAVVVTTGPGPGLEATVASLEAQDYPELSVLVVANGESEHVAARVAAVAPTAFVRVLDENRGFAAACNEASLMVEGSAFFLFCHDDVRLESNAVQQMVEAAFRANAGIVSPKYVRYEDPLVLLHVGQTCDRFGVVQERVEFGEIDHGQQDLERDVFVAPGGVTLVRSDLFVTLRGFDPLIVALGEDLDLCWRAQIAGARIVVAPSAKVAHRESIARGERAITAKGVRRSSRKDLQRRHQLLVVSTGWGRRMTVNTLVMLAVLETVEFVVALLGRDTDRAGAIVGSWRWLFHNRVRIRERRRERQLTRVLTDADMQRLQVGGASRLRRFIVTLWRDGLDRARGILPQEPEVGIDEAEEAGVGFATAFAEAEEFDEIPESAALQQRRRPSRLLTSFRSQAGLLALVALAWMIGSRNLVAMHLPLVGRLAPLDSWWTTWRHFFASWSSNGVGTVAPAMPGYGVLGFAGTFVLGRMGILPRLALIGAVPLGAYGVARLLRGRVSNRARVIATVLYLALPLGLDMISQGRIDVLIVVAGLPFVVRRLFELLEVPGFREIAYGPRVSFGLHGWRASEPGQRMVAIMLIALLSAMAPATIVAVVLIVLGVVLARFFESDPAAAHPWRLLGAIVLGLAAFLLPMTINVIIAGRQAPEVLGLARGPWSAPSFWQILHAGDGSFGSSWLAWLAPVAALLGLVLSRGERRLIATKIAAIATLTIVVATLDARHWMGSFAPDLDVLLALYGVMLAVLIGLGISAIEVDLHQIGFGWRQMAAGVVVTTIVAAMFPFMASFATGRFNLPMTSVAESMNALAPVGDGGYRVLWLGDPSVIPIAGWSVAPGVSAATSMNGMPGGATLFTAPEAGTSSTLLGDVQLALEGRTVRLGELLARAGVSTIVVMNSSAPELGGVQSVSLHPVPADLLSTLARQTDLSLTLHTPSMDIYADSLYHGILASTRNGTLTPVKGELFDLNAVSSPSTVSAAVAPASVFDYFVNGEPSARGVSSDWVPTFQVSDVHPPAGGDLQGRLVLRRFPFNGIIALLTLCLWALVWLGFGWVHRLEWIFRLRQRRTTTGRHAKQGSDG